MPATDHTGNPTTTPATTMRNYFNYFTEIEERFQQRRGSILMLSTLDWALIETWREAGIPLAAVLRGIDEAFDKHDAKKQTGRISRKKINGLAWCAQSVMQATEDLAEAAIGTASTKPEVESGFESQRIATYLKNNAALLQKTSAPSPADAVIATAASRLLELAEEALTKSEASAVEDLERTLLVQEEKIFAALKLAAPEDVIVNIKAQAARELAPYRSRMQAPQLRQVEEQFLQKRLLEHYRLPRLSLFYMGHD